MLEHYVKTSNELMQLVSGVMQWDSLFVEKNVEMMESF